MAQACCARIRVCGVQASPDRQFQRRADGHQIDHLHGGGGPVSVDIQPGERGAVRQRSEGAGQLQLQRLEARVHAANASAKKLIRLLGFMPEGRLNGYVLRDGSRHDVDVFGLLATQALRH